MTAIPSSGEIHDVSDFLNEIEKTGLPSQRQAHLRIWYRGQPISGKDIQPGIYRQTFNVKGEQERLQKEQQITQDFRVQSASLRSPHDTDADLYFLQQHYGVPTRLLDWTLRPLAALYFATGNSTVEGDVFIMDAHNLLVHQGAPSDHRGISTSRRPRFIREIQVISHWKDAADFDRFIIPVRADQADRRVILQQGCFTFHVPKKPILSKTENDKLFRLTIPTRDKEKIRRQLFMLGVDEFAIYGDLDHLASRLKFAHDVS